MAMRSLKVSAELAQTNRKLTGSQYRRIIGLINDAGYTDDEAYALVMIQDGHVIPSELMPAKVDQAIIQKEV